MGLEDNTLLQQLSAPDVFHVWNSGSVSHLLIASSGFNGILVRNKALEVLSRYYKWCEENTNQHIIPIDELKRSITYVQNNSTESHNEENLTKYLEMMES